jgi:molybdopterin synthase catalytic subunit
MASSQAEEVWEMVDEGCFVGLTNDHLNVEQTMDKVRSPAAGAIVLFAGESHSSVISLLGPHTQV